MRQGNSSESGENSRGNSRSSDALPSRPAARDPRLHRPGEPGAVVARAEAGEIAALLDRYSGQLAVDHSEATVRAYLGDIRGFLAYAGRRAPTDRADVARLITTRSIRGWLAARPTARATTARRLSSIGSFTAWLRRVGVIDDDPAATLSAPRGGRRLPAVLRADQIEEVLAVAAREASTGDPAALRDQAVVELLYATGIRVSELCGIDIDEVDFDRSVVRVLGKGDKQRIAPFGVPAATALRAWLSHGRPALAQPTSGPALFLGARGGRLDQRQARTAVHRAVDAVGGLPSVAPHGLRHTAATHVLDGGADLRVVQELLGHASMATTQIYTHISMQRLRAAHDRAHPRAE